MNNRSMNINFGNDGTWVLTGSVPYEKQLANEKKDLYVRVTAHWYVCQTPYNIGVLFKYRGTLNSLYATLYANFNIL